MTIYLLDDNLKLNYPILQYLIQSRQRNDPVDCTKNMKFISLCNRWFYGHLHELCIDQILSEHMVGVNLNVVYKDSVQL